MTEQAVIIRKRPWRSVLVSILVTLCFIVALGLTKFFQIREAIAQHGSFKPPPEGVSIVKAVEQDWLPLYRVAGTIKAIQGVLLRSQESGVVGETLIETGAKVAAGDVLVKLDTSVERAQLSSARSKLDWTKSEFERATKLWEQKATSKSALQSATANRDQAESEVQRLQALIDRKEIKAPFEGKVGIRQVDKGDYLSPGAALVELQQIDGLYVDFAVPLRVLTYVQVGQNVFFDHDGSKQMAQIVGIDPSADRSTLTVNVRAQVTPNSRALVPGMYVGVDVPSDTPARLIAVPVSSVAYAPYGNSVFILKRAAESLTVESRTVRLGTAIGDKVPVLAGIKVGEEVVTAGAFKLRDGAAVVVNNDVPAESDPLLPNT